MGHRRRVQAERPHHGFERVSHIPSIYEHFLTSLSGPHLRFKPRDMQKGMPVFENVAELRPVLQSRSMTVSTMETS